MNHSRGSSPNPPHQLPQGLCVLLPGFGVQVKSHSSGHSYTICSQIGTQAKQFCSRKSLAALIALQNHRDHIEQRGLKESRGKYISIYPQGATTRPQISEWNATHFL